MGLSQGRITWLDDWLSLWDEPCFLLSSHLALLGANPGFCVLLKAAFPGEFDRLWGRPLQDLEAFGITWNRTPLWLPEIHECILFRGAQAAASGETLKKRDDLISVAAHEIRTPLTSIKLIMQLLSRLIENPNRISQQTKRVHQMIEDATLQVDQVSRLLEQFLDLSHLERDRTKTVRNNIDLNQIIHEAILLARPQLDRQNINLSFNRGPPAPVLADPDRLRSVFLNLIINAMKYGNLSPISIFVEDFNSELRTLVVDRGGGIPPDLLSKIFSPYERGEKRGDVKGHGLGLYISRSIVESHGGKIWATPTRPSGATFVVSLPKASG